VVNLLPKLGVGVGLWRHDNWLTWNVHLLPSFSAVIALKWCGLAPRRHRLLRIVVGVAWPRCVVP
jgi:hypothetical protein